MSRALSVIASLSSGNEGDRARADFLKYLSEHPGLIVSDCAHQHEEVQLMVGADGGCMWFCARCKDFSSPNSPCGCFG